MPTVATSPTDLLAAIAPTRPPRRRAPGHRRRGGLPRRRHPRPRLDRRVQRRRGHDRGRPVARLGGEPGARRPIGEHPGAVRRPRPRRGRRVHRPGDQPAGPDLRHGADGLRGGRRGRRRRGHPRARPERADLHLPAPDRLRDLGAGRRDRGGLAGPGLHPGRPLPVQRQEVRRRPRGDDRGDPARLPTRDRRRLPQHRHRFLDARRPVEAERRRAAARELPPRGRADRAHPDARDATASRSASAARSARSGRRTRRSRSCAPTSTATAASSTRSRPGATGISKVSVQTGTSHGGVPLPDGGVAEVKLDFEVLRELGVVAREYGLAGAVQHGASTLPGRAVPPLPGGRDGRDPPRDRVPERALRAPGVPGGAPPRDRGVVLRRMRPTSARPDQTDQQFVYTTRKKAIGPFKRQLWELDPEGRDPGRAASQDLVPVHRAAGQRLARRWSTATSSRSRLHRPDAPTSPPQRAVRRSARNRR